MHPDHLTRRQFVRRASASVAVPMLAGGCARSINQVALTETTPEPVLVAESPAVVASPSRDLLPSPDFSRDRILRCIAGVRPYRSGGVRLAAGRIGAKTVVHNYGHGGAGITLAWGSAEIAADLADEAAPNADALVLGAGVIGLTSAMELLDRGRRVSIWAADFPPYTTSNVAGGQWSPSSVATGGGYFAEMCRRSFRRYEDQVGEEFAVFRRPNYVVGRSGGGGFRLTPRGVLAPRERVERVPFEGPDRSGSVWHTLLVEPERFLNRLMDELRERCDSIEQRSVGSFEELDDAPQRLIVNCTGLGAGALCDDASVEPVKGQLVILEAQDLPYLLSHRGYIFPRSDGVVLGGSYERGRSDTDIDEGVCERILRTNAAFFEA